MGIVNLPVTSRANTDPNLASDFISNDTAITAQVNGNLDNNNIKSGAGVAGTKLAAASVADDRLASPNNSAYKTLVRLQAYTNAVSTGTYYVGGGVGGDVLIATGLTTASTGDVPRGLLNFASGDLSVGSLTTRFRVTAQAFVGSTSPSTVTLNTGLYPVTLSGGNWTLGTVVTGSTTGTSPTPALATNTISRYDSGDFPASALLSDPGVYALGVVVGSITVPNGIAIAMQLHTRNT